MTHIRFWTSLTIGWFCLLFSVELFHVPLDLEVFIYPMAAGLAIAGLASRTIRNLPPIAVSVLVLTLFCILKITWTSSVVGQDLAVTVTELCVLFITWNLSKRLAKQIEQFEDTSLGLLASRGVIP